MKSTASVDDSKFGNFKRWLEARIWIIVADVTGVTFLLAITASPLLGEWLFALLIGLPVLISFISLSPREPERKVEPPKRKVSDIRIFIAPREDDYDYQAVA